MRERVRERENESDVIPWTDNKYIKRKNDERQRERKREREEERKKEEMKVI